MGYEDQCGWSKIRKEERNWRDCGQDRPYYYTLAFIFSSVCERLGHFQPSALGLRMEGCGNMDTFAARNRPSCSRFMCNCEQSDINPCITL